jgi:hypothetical protein
VEFQRLKITHFQMDLWRTRILQGTQAEPVRSLQRGLRS